MLIYIGNKHYHGRTPGNKFVRKPIMGMQQEIRLYLVLDCGFL